MKAKRAKQYRKLMHQYGLHFGFREPYQVLIDAGTIKDAARFKMKLGSMLENTLHGQIKPMVTQCCIRHLYDIQPSTPQEKAEKDAWIEAAKNAERRRCGHHKLEEPLSALECLESVVDPKESGRNKHRYVVASQDEEVRRRMRAIAGVPLVYINRSVMILEPIAGATEDVRAREEKEKIRAGLKGGRGAAGVKRKREEENGDERANVEAGEPATDQETKKRKVKGPKGPNPLSVMKSKKVKIQRPNDAPQPEKQAAVLQKSDSNIALGDGARKRTRKRKRKGGSEVAGAAVEADE